MVKSEFIPKTQNIVAILKTWIESKKCTYKFLTLQSQNQSIKNVHRKNKK